MPDEPRDSEPTARPTPRRIVLAIVLAVSCGGAVQYLILRPEPHALMAVLLTAAWMALVMGVSSFIRLRYPNAHRRLTLRSSRDRRRRRQQRP